MSDLEGQVVVVTGAAGGLGAAIAETAVRQGASVALLDLDAGRLHEFAKRLARLGPLGAWTADVAVYSQVEEAVKDVGKHLGPIAVLVNCAGILRDAFVTEIDDSDWDRMLNVNLKGPFNCIKAILPGMIEHRRGSIVNIASLGAKSSWSFTGAHYCASKAGLIGLTKQVAKQVAEHNIRVNAVAPSTARTSMTKGRSTQQLESISQRIPLGRLASPEDVAMAVLFLASSKASFITGYTLDVNGGAYMD